MKERYLEIDGLKIFLAISMVMAHYAAMDGAPISRFKMIFENNAIALPVFFVISGFCISKRYKDELKEKSFTSFFKRRFAILFPPALISNIIGLFLWLWWGNKMSIYNTFLSFTMMGKIIDSDSALSMGGFPHNGVTWYVGWLLICYIIYYVIAHYSKDRSAYIIMASALFLLGWSVLLNDFHVMFLYHSKALASFFAGVLLCEVDDTVKLKRTLTSISCLLLISMLMVGVLGNLTEYIGNLDIANAIIIAPAIILVTVNVRPVKKVLSNRVFVYLGKYSYAIFLVHQLVYKVFRIMQRTIWPSFKFDTMPSFILVFCVVMLISFVWYQIIEKRVGPKIGVWFTE